MKRYVFKVKNISTSIFNVEAETEEDAIRQLIDGEEFGNEIVDEDDYQFDDAELIEVTEI